MKKSILIVSSIFLLFICLSFNNFEDESPAHHIRLDFSNKDFIRLSTSDLKYEEISIKGENAKGINYVDFGPILKMASDLESKGYEIVSSNSTGNSMAIHLKK